MSGLIAPSGAPGRILRAIHEGQVETVVSWELVREVVDVLRRPKFKRYGITDDDIEELITALGPRLPTVEVAVEVRDADDVPVVVAAMAGRVEAIVTGDRDFLDDAALQSWLMERGIEVLSPAEALVRLRG